MRGEASGPWRGPRPPFAFAVRVFRQTYRFQTSAGASAARTMSLTCVAICAPPHHRCAVRRQARRCNCRGDECRPCRRVQTTRLRYCAPGCGWRLHSAARHSIRKQFRSACRRSRHSRTMCGARAPGLPGAAATPAPQSHSGRADRRPADDAVIFSRAFALRRREQIGIRRGFGQRDAHAAREEGRIRRFGKFHAGFEHGVECVAQVRERRGVVRARGRFIRSGKLCGIGLRNGRRVLNGGLGS